MTSSVVGESTPYRLECRAGSRSRDGVSGGMLPSVPARYSTLASSYSGSGAEEAIRVCRGLAVMQRRWEQE